MSGQQPLALLGLQHQIQLAGTEGSLTWLIQEMRTLAQADQSTEGVTPEDWAELAEAGEQWRQSITDLLDFIAKQKGGA